MNAIEARLREQLLQCKTPGTRAYIEQTNKAADEIARLERQRDALLVACRKAETLVATMQGMPPSVELIEEVREDLENAIAFCEEKS